jgi:C-terminal processing protease CtpA/Prc
MTTVSLFPTIDATRPLLHESSFQPILDKSPFFFNGSYKYKIKTSFNWFGRKIYEIKDCIVEKIKKITNIIYNFISNFEFMNQKFYFNNTALFTHKQNKSNLETILNSDKSSVFESKETIFNENNIDKFCGNLSPKHHNNDSQLKHNFGEECTGFVSDEIHEETITFYPSDGCEVFDGVNNQNTVSKESSLGIFVRGEPVGFIVEKFREGFPVAEDKTLKLGDIIIEVGDKNVKGIFITQLGEMLKGPPGSLVNVKVLRQLDHSSFGFYRPLVLTLKRGFE